MTIATPRRWSVWRQDYLRRRARGDGGELAGGGGRRCAPRWARSCSFPAGGKRAEARGGGAPGGARIRRSKLLRRAPVLRAEAAVKVDVRKSAARALDTLLGELRALILGRGGGDGQRARAIG